MVPDVTDDFDAASALAFIRVPWQMRPEFRFTSAGRFTAGPEGSYHAQITRRVLAGGAIVL